MLHFISVFCICLCSINFNLFNRSDDDNTLLIEESSLPSMYAIDNNELNYLFSMYEVINTDNFINYYSYSNDSKYWFDTLFDGGSVAVDYLEYFTQVYSGTLFNGYDSIDYSDISIPSGGTSYDFNAIRLYFINRTVFDSTNNVVQLSFKLRFYDSGLNQFKNLGNIDGIMFYVVRRGGFEGEFMTYRGDYGNINNWCIIVDNSDSNLFTYLFLHNSDTDYQLGYNSGYNVGRQVGYGEGYADGSNVDATASTIFTGILDIALIPVNVFLTIFNFNVFGINIAGIVSGLLTLSIVIIIFRFLLGGKSNDK